jgi:hypothetical protein
VIGTDFAEVTLGAVVVVVFAFVFVDPGAKSVIEEAVVLEDEAAVVVAEVVAVAESFELMDIVSFGTDTIILVVADVSMIVVLVLVVMTVTGIVVVAAVEESEIVNDDMNPPGVSVVVLRYGAANQVAMVVAFVVAVAGVEVGFVPTSVLIVVSELPIVRSLFVIAGNVVVFASAIVVPFSGLDIDHVHSHPKRAETLACSLLHHR